MAVQDEVREAVDALTRSQGAPAGVYALFSFTPDDRVARMTTAATIARCTTIYGEYSSCEECKRNRRSMERVKPRKQGTFYSKRDSAMHLHASLSSCSRRRVMACPYVCQTRPSYLRLHTTRSAC